MSGGFGLFVPGQGPLYRAPAGAKLAGLVALAAAVWAAARWPWALAAAVGALVAAGWASGLGSAAPRLVWRQLRPMAVPLALVAALQLMGRHWWAAAGIPVAIACLAAAAALVTATTRAEALVGAVAWAARPLERFGVDPDRVGLILLITVGALPAVAALAHGAREAQAARCGARGVTAFAVPLAVAALRRADTLGEALTARGFDD